MSISLLLNHVVKKLIVKTLHMHHIIPQYVFGRTPSVEDLAFRNSVHNVLSLSLADHIIAHELLY
jgi:hypothetical protein